MSEKGEKLTARLYDCRRALRTAYQKLEAKDDPDLVHARGVCLEAIQAIESYEANKPASS